MSSFRSPQSPSGADPQLVSAVPLADNAFLVLGLTPRATWPQVVEAGERLTAALQAQDPESAQYATPLGARPRTAASVCRAMTRLRDPDERIQHEIWWEAPHHHRPLPSIDDRPSASVDAAWGWRPR